MSTFQRSVSSMTSSIWLHLALLKYVASIVAVTACSPMYLASVCLPWARNYSHYLVKFALHRPKCAVLVESSFHVIHAFDRNCSIEWQYRESRHWFEWLLLWPFVCPSISVRMGSASEHPYASNLRFWLTLASAEWATESLDCVLICAYYCYRMPVQLAECYESEYAMILNGTITFFVGLFLSELWMA